MSDYDYDEQEQRIKKLILDDLEETYHGVERRRNDQNDPKSRLILSIDRWGPGVISLITFLAMITIGWTYGERISRMEGKQAVVLECIDKQSNINQRVSNLESKSAKDREDWEFAVAKLENFEKIVTRLLIKAGLM